MIRYRMFVFTLILGAMLHVPAAAKEEAKMPTEDLTAEAVGSWVQEARFPVWITKMPSLSVLLARYPYAANLFYLRSEFRDWSERFPAEARAITEAAMRWQNLNAYEKEIFFCRHPVLRSKDVAGAVMDDGLNPQQRAQ